MYVATEEETQAMFIEMMEVVETCEQLILFTQKMEELPFEKVTEEAWASFQEVMPGMRFIVEMLKFSMSKGEEIMGLEGAFDLAEKLGKEAEKEIG